MNRLLNPRDGRLGPSTASGWIWYGCLLLAALQIFAISASADDMKSALRAHLEEDNSEEEEIDDEDVRETPDRFRRVSNRQSVADSSPVRTPSASSDGPGMIGQAGHLAFKTFGRNQSISPIEAMPYVLTDEHFFFGDLRGFVSNSALFGGNVGLGYRHLREDLNAWFGSSVWYDNDGTSGKNFQQVGLSFEGLIDRFELRSNVYLPVTSAQTYSSNIGNERILGHQLLYTRYTDIGKALQGVDFEAGYSLPVRDVHRLRAFVGYYHFNGGPTGGINGFKTRLEGVINNSVTAQVLYTNDKLFGSNVMVGCQIQLPWGSSHPTSNWKQNTPSPFRFVERNYNVIVDRGVQADDNLVAVNPLTHAAYNIEQVNSNAPLGGDGTFANPFKTIAAAQSAGGDIILVQGNSVLTTGAVLSAGQQLLGDGSLQPLALDGGGTLHLPTQIAGGATPQFSGVVGSAVTMANNTTFAGFNILNNTGNAISGASVSGVTLRDIHIQNTTGDAIRFTNASGSLLMQNITVNSATGYGVNVAGGSPDLIFSGSITGAQADGMLISSLSGGSVDIHDTTIQSTGGAGLRLTNNAADITVNSLTTTQTAGTAIAITGGTSSNTYRFKGTTTINQPAGTGFSVDTTNAAVTVDDLVVNSTAASPAVSLTNSTGKITLSNLDLTTTNALGLYGRGLTSLLISNGSITTVNAGAIDVQNSTIDTTLSQVSVNGSTFGIQLVNNVGKFNINGNSAYASGGTIKNTTTGIILNDTGNVSINWLDMTSNGTAILSTGNAQVNLNGLRIADSTGYAVDSQNDLVLMITNSTLTNNGAVGGGTIRAQVSTVASYQWLVQGNLIEDHNGTPVLMRTLAGGNGASLATTVQLNSVTADRSGATFINIDWNGPLSSSIAHNVLNAGADNMTGVILKDSSATDSIITRINNNQMTFLGNNSTGILVNAAAGSTVQIDDNAVDFKGVNGTGLRFNLAGISSDWIYSNTITDEAGGATGMLFDSVAASSRLQIEANTINLLSTDLTVHRGIVFTTVTPTIQFSGNFNNIITNTSTPFSIPVNSSTGHIIVNGVLVP